MTGPTWANATHSMWLANKLPEYHDAQKRRAVTRFLKSTFEAWFQAFPLRAEVLPNKPMTELLTEAENLRVEALRPIRKQQIRTWFSWRRLTNLSGKKGRGGRGGRRTSGAKAIDELAEMLKIKIEKKEGRAPQQIEVYQAKFKDKVWAEINLELQRNPPLPGVSIPAALMTTRRSVTQRMLAAEPPHVHQMIKDYIADWKARNKASAQSSEDDDSEDEDEEPTPEQLQRAIELLPEFLERFFGPCSRATGWNFFIMGAGPIPAMGGKVYMESHHFGAKSPAGNTFSEAYVDFKKNVSSPFCKYAMSVHTAEICAARALKTNQTDAESLANASLDGPESPASSTTTPPAAASTTSSTAAALQTLHKDTENVANASSDDVPASSTTSSRASPPTSSTAAASVCSTAASASPTASGVQLDHSIINNAMIGGNTGTDQHSLTTAGVPNNSMSVGLSAMLNAEAGGGLGGGGGLLDWERDLLASMGDISHDELFDIDYTDSAFTDLPNTNMLGTTHVSAPMDDGRGGYLAPEFSVAQALPPIQAQNFAQTGVRVNGFIFPNNLNVFGGVSQPARSAALLDTGVVDHRVPAALATEVNRSVNSYTDAHVTQTTAAVPILKRRFTADLHGSGLDSMDPGTANTAKHANDPTLTSAMGDISNKVTLPKKGRGSNNKRKAQPEVGVGGEPENMRRTKRKVVAPARRDKTPELTSVLYKKRVAL